jgi:hypothetical protein
MTPPPSPEPAAPKMTPRAAKLIEAIRSQKWTTDYRQAVGVIEALISQAQECDRLRFLIWHRHYNPTCPLTVEEKENIQLGAPPESNA